MASRQVSYDDDQAYILNRPILDQLTLHGPGGPRGTTTFTVLNSVLVDTGADYTQLDIAAAAYVGLDPVASGRRVRVATAGGVVPLHELDVDLEFLGRRVQATVHFGAGAVPLLGRQGLFRAVSAAGFETSEWLQQWYAPAAPAGSGGARPRHADAARREDRDAAVRAWLAETRQAYGDDRELLRLLAESFGGRTLGGVAI